MNNQKLSRDKLCNEFPYLYMKDIDIALQFNNNKYNETLTYLQNQLKGNKLKLKKIPSKKRNIPELNKPLEIKPKEEMIECNCCFDMKPFQDFSHCTEGHLICKVCVKKHAENTIYQSQSYKIKCIDCNEKCNGYFDLQLLEPILDIRVISEYKNLKNTDEISQLCIDDINIKICQHCNAGTDIGENLDQEILVCMECFKDTCLKCNQVSHIGKPCHSLGNIAQNKRQEIENKMTEALILNCSRCKKSILKESGCNKITCVCRTINCYICKSVITGYAHFCNIKNCKCNKCHLWDDDSKTRILNAVKDEKDKETQKLIKGLL